MAIKRLIALAAVLGVLSVVYFFVEENSTPASNQEYKLTKEQLLAVYHAGKRDSYAEVIAICKRNGKIRVKTKYGFLLFECKSLTI